jgi:hypothetical protein
VKINKGKYFYFCFFFLCIHTQYLHLNGKNQKLHPQIHLFSLVRIIILWLFSYWGDTPGFYCLLCCIIYHCSCTVLLSFSEVLLFLWRILHKRLIRYTVSRLVLWKSEIVVVWEESINIWMTSQSYCNDLYLNLSVMQMNKEINFFRVE